MPRTISEYVTVNPAPRHHQKAGEKVATAAPVVSAGWAWKPDEQTKLALARGSRKIRRAKSLQNEDNTMATSKKVSKKKASAKKVTKKKASAKKVSKKVTTKKTGGIPLARICADLKLDAKMARRKLRAAEFGSHEGRSRWEFTDAQAKKVRELLSA